MSYEAKKPVAKRSFNVAAAQASIENKEEKKEVTFNKRGKFQSKNLPPPKILNYVEPKLPTSKGTLLFRATMENNKKLLKFATTVKDMFQQKMDVYFRPDSLWIS